MTRRTRKLGIAAVLLVVLAAGLIAVFGKREADPPFAATFVRYEGNSVAIQGDTSRAQAAARPITLPNGTGVVGALSARVSGIGYGRPAHREPASGRSRGGLQRRHRRCFRSITAVWCKASRTAGTWLIALSRP